MRAPIRLGLQISNFTYPGVASDRLFERVVDIATAAEEAGFDTVTVMDHLHQIGVQGPPTNSMLEGNAILSALAARTSSVTLGLMVGGVTYRNPALLAKIATTLDVISGGRAFLGIGAAWFEGEHVAYGFRFPPMAERFERLEEALQIMRGMFTQSETSFEGKHYRVARALNNPQPIRGDIPILVGGSGERKTLRFVAKYADGSNILGDVARVRHLLGVLDGHCDAVGRDPSEITKTRLGTLAIGRTHEDAERKLVRLHERNGAPLEQLRSTAVHGDPDEVGEQVRTYLDTGLDGLIFNLPDVHDVDTVRLAGETLAPLLAVAAR